MERRVLRRSHPPDKIVLLMRAAALFGLGSSAKNLKPFRDSSTATWHFGIPANSKQADVILIFGGDGTIHRHLSQLVNLQLPVLVVPHGSGNDFARALNLRSVRDSVKAWRKFLSDANNVRTIDLGVISPLVTDPLNLGAAPPPQHHYFCLRRRSRPGRRSCPACE